MSSGHATDGGDRAGRDGPPGPRGADAAAAAAGGRSPRPPPLPACVSGSGAYLLGPVPGEAVSTHRRAEPEPEVAARRAGRPATAGSCWPPSLGFVGSLFIVASAPVWYLAEPAWRLTVLVHPASGLVGLVDQHVHRRPGADGARLVGAHRPGRPVALHAPGPPGRGGAGRRRVVPADHGRAHRCSAATPTATRRRARWPRGGSIPPPTAPRSCATAGTCARPTRCGAARPAPYGPGGGRGREAGGRGHRPRRRRVGVGHAGGGPAGHDHGRRRRGPHRRSLQAVARAWPWRWASPTRWCCCTCWAGATTTRSCWASWRWASPRTCASASSSACCWWPWPSAVKLTAAPALIFMAWNWRDDPSFTVLRRIRQSAWVLAGAAVVVAALCAGGRRRVSAGSAPSRAPASR